jgi:N-methylhydantoinase B
MFGGHAGAPSVMVKLANTRVNQLLAKNQPLNNLCSLGGQENVLQNCNFELSDSDVLYMRVASGGGYGDPLERDPELVRTDVANLMVSRDAAGKIYGVVLNADLTVDSTATRELREQLRRGERDAT